MARIDNLGDYGVIPGILKEHGGKIINLFADVGAKAIVIASPFLLGAGAFAGVKIKKLIDEEPEKVLEFLRKYFPDEGLEP